MRLALAVAALLAGCVSPAQRQQHAQMQQELVQTIPTCSSERECELKWSAARQWILSNAGMKLQHVTNDFLETYNPPRDSSSLAARVVKEPLPQGGYRFLITTWCNNIFMCIPNQWQAALHFNRYVNAVPTQ